jgi:SAM-dependent methyltransferase
VSDKARHSGLRLLLPVHNMGRMENPWLSVPLEDYEGHMKSAGVRQLTALSDLFADAIAFCRPASIALLGIAGGNGLDHIDGKITHRVVGLDVNPSYLEAVRRRYQSLRGLELHCIDLVDQVADLEPVALVHAALVFEHAGVGRCLDNALSIVAPGGAISVVLQLPSQIEQGVGASRFSSIENLKGHFSLIDPFWLRETLELRKFSLAFHKQRPLAAGKAFWMDIFTREKVEGTN